MSFISGFGHETVRTMALEPLWGKNERATDHSTRIGENVCDVMNLLGAGAVTTGAARAKSPMALLGAAYGAAQVISSGKHLFAGVDNARDPFNRL